MFGYSHMEIYLCIILKKVILSMTNKICYLILKLK